MAKFIFLSFIMLSLLALIQALNENATQPETSGYNSLADNLSLMPNASIINKLISKEYLTDINDLLSQCVSKKTGKTPLLFFVPTDDAIQKALNEHQNVTGTNSIEELEQSEAGRNYIRALLHLHIVNGSFSGKQALNKTLIPTLLNYAPYVLLGNSPQVLHVSNNTKKLPTIEHERDSLSQRTIYYFAEANQNEPNQSISIVSVYHTRTGLSIANFTGPAVNCSNGILQMIDNVIPIPPNSTEQLRNANLTTFQRLIKATGLAGAINKNPQTTILAPTNQAFDQFRGKLQELADSASRVTGLNRSTAFYENRWAIDSFQEESVNSREVKSPITRMQQGSNELQAFSLTGPVYHLYSTEGSHTQEDDIVTERDNATLAQYTKFGLSKTDVKNLILAHIIENEVVYSINTTNTSRYLTSNGYSIQLSRINENGSFISRIYSNVTSTVGPQESNLVEPLGQNGGAHTDTTMNSTAIYLNVLTKNGVLHIMNSLIMIPGFMANVSDKISKVAQANFNVLQYCDSMIRDNRSNQSPQTQYFTHGVRKDFELQAAESLCGDNEKVCWVQTELNTMCVNAYRNGPQSFIDALSKQQPKSTCYSPSTHVCVNSTTLCPIEAPEQCSGICYSPANYTCSNHFFLCDNQHSQRCGDACYSSDYYECKDNSILVNKGNTTVARKP